MADKEIDKPEYQKGSLKEDWEYAKNSGIAMMLISSIAALPFFVGGTLTETTLNEHIKTDHNLYTGIFDTEKNFSHIARDHGDTYPQEGMLLVRNMDGQFELYKRMPDDTQRLILMDYDEAVATIGTISQLIKARAEQFANRDISPFGEYSTFFVNERIDAEVSLPYVLNGQTERISKYTYRDDVQGDELQERFAQELAFWQEAGDAINQNPLLYGVDEDSITDTASPGFGEVLLHNAKDNAPLPLALMAFAGLLGGGIGMVESRVKRRERRNAASEKKPAASKDALAPDFEQQIENDTGKTPKERQPSPAQTAANRTAYKAPKPYQSPTSKPYQSPSSKPSPRPIKRKAVLKRK